MKLLVDPILYDGRKVPAIVALSDANYKYLLSDANHKYLEYEEGRNLYYLIGKTKWNRPMKCYWLAAGMYAILIILVMCRRWDSGERLVVLPYEQTQKEGRGIKDVYV